MVKKRATAMERLLLEGFFDSREAALPYLMSGSVFCGQQPVTTGGQLVPMDKPLTVRGLYDRYVSKGGYKLEGAIRDLGAEVAGRVTSTRAPAQAALPTVCSSTARRGYMPWR